MKNENNDSKNNNNLNNENPSPQDQEQHENFQINPEDIREIEEIDKEALKKEIEGEMDLEEDLNEINAANNHLNDEDEEGLPEENFDENKNAESSSYPKEYPDFKAKGEIYAINFHQSSGTLIIGDGEDTTYFYNLDKKCIIKEEKLNKDSVNFIKFSNDNKYLLTASVDGTINIFSCEKNFELLNTINDQDTEINWVEWHPKGPAFAFGSAEGVAWVYMATNINNNFNFYSHTESCTCGSFLDEGKRLITGGEDCAVKIYDLKEKKIEYSISNKSKNNKNMKFIKNPITCLAICNSKSIVAVCSIANEICLVNYNNGTVVYYFQYQNKSAENPNSIESVSFCYNDQYIVFTDSESHLNIFEMKSMSLRSSLEINGDNLTKIVPSKKKSYEIYCSGSNGYMYKFDTRGVGSVVLREKCHDDVIMDFIVTENENFILTSSLDKTINLVKIVDLED